MSKVRALSIDLRSRRDRLAIAILVVAMVIGAIITLVWGSDSLHVALPPTPPAPSTASLIPGTSAPSAPVNRAKAAKPFHCGRAANVQFGSAVPAEICIPAIKVSASVMQLGINADRTVQVPPLSQVGDAGWYKYSAAPGNVGPTVIIGHVDSAQYGEGVFFKLSRLHGGDTVRMRRADGKTATFRIDRVSQVPKTRFPTQAVYGATTRPALRLVTCGGKFDSATGNYLDNIIAYGTLVSLRGK